MPVPVGLGHGVVGVGVAVVAEVQAGVVLADVLGHYAAAGEALAGVFLVRAGLPFGLNAEKRVARDELRANELHEFRVAREALHHQPVVDAAGVLDAVVVEILDFAACSPRDAPALHELAYSLRDFAHLVGLEFARGKSAALQVLANLGIRLDVDEAEHNPRPICREYVAKTLHPVENVLDRKLVSDN